MDEATDFDKLGEPRSQTMWTIGLPRRDVMLERWTGMMGVRGGVLVALGLALAVPAAGCKKKEESSEKDEKASSKDDDTEKASKKKKSSDDDEDEDKDTKKKSKKASDDDDDTKKTAKKAKAPKDVDDDDDDDDEDEAPKAKPKLKPLKGAIDVSGSWGVAGKNDAGTKYSGTATISKIGGSMYKASWKIGSEVQQGRCFLDGNVLSCGWAPKHDVGVMAYLVKPGTLDGVWFEEQNTKLGLELLKGSTGGDLTGNFLISKGEMPDTKKAYGGNVSIKRLSNGVYTLTWKLSNGTFKGLGLRSNHFAGSDTDVLSAGFNDAGDGGVLQYIIYEGGKTMHGHWAIPPKNGGTPGWGKETMVKAD